MKAVRFLVNFFAVDGSGNRYVKYRQGQVYTSDDETLGQVVAGNAMEVEEGAASQGEIPLEDTAVQIPAPQAPSEETAEETAEQTAEASSAKTEVGSTEGEHGEVGPTEVAEAA